METMNARLIHLLRNVALTVVAASVMDAGASAADPVFYHAPKPLASDAVVSDWPRFLGPLHNATSPETRLLRGWGDKGPTRVWEYPKGLGHSGPAIADGRVVLFHRVGDEEVVDCLEAETGKLLWSHRDKAPYRDRYGSGDGPRNNPVIGGGSVFVSGITGHLRCIALSSGNLVWQRDLVSDYTPGKNFFGLGSTPLFLEGRLVLNVGGAGDVCAVALDPATGREVWRARHPWGASYASPIPAKLHGRECVLIFAGGESRPPTGGLLTLDAATGEVLNATPHRAGIAESVHASSPAVDGNRVFVGEAYGAGGLMVEVGADFKAKQLWKADRFSVYLMTPVVRDGFLYGFDGQSPRLAELVCYESATGRERWRDDLGGQFQRGSLLAADGGVLCLGENGRLAWMELSPEKARVVESAALFAAPETWTLPALSHGLLYVCQNQRSGAGDGPRLICFDLRATR